MTLTSEQRLRLEAILSSDEILSVTSPGYVAETRCWAAQKSLQPPFVLRPTSIIALQRTVKYLCESDLDFAVRCSAAGSSSGQDVNVSMSAFNDFQFDASTEVVTIGAGQSWGDIERKLAEIAPDYKVVGARVPWVGVGGSITHSGLSWLSSEFGIISDPQNLLDAQIVLPDGRLTWASSEPDLLWGLRGAGGNFGEFVSRNTDPKIAMHVFLLNSQSEVLPSPVDVIGLLVYDANGLDHGRSEAGFKWALEILGAVDMTKSMSLTDLHLQQGDGVCTPGKFAVWQSSALVEIIDADFLVRAYDWFEKVKEDNALSKGSYILIEVMQEATFTSTNPESTAWPHPTSRRHILQLGTGFPSDNSGSRALAVQLLHQGLHDIPQEPADPSAFLPLFLEDFHDLSKIYGSNYDRLRHIKLKYDPRGRFNKGAFIPPAVEKIVVLSNDDLDMDGSVQQTFADA